MDKSEPAKYYGPPSAPEEYSQQQGEYQPQSGYLPPPAYSSQPGYPPQPGYQPQYPGYPPPPGICPQPEGYPGQQPPYGYPAEPGYPPPQGYPGQNYPNQNVATVTVRPVVDPAAPSPPRKRGWCEDNQRNKPQANSLSAATLIFTSGGMNLAWSAGFAPGFIGITQSARTHMQICWYVAIVIGTIISSLLVSRVQKRTFYLVASVLILIEGILFVSAPDSIAAADIARYCDGIAFGLALVPAIIAGSEESVKRFRGLVLTVEQIGLVTGIMLKTIYMNFWESDWSIDSTQLQGILTLVYGVLAFIFTFVFTIESPVFFLLRDNETEATNSLRQLQRPQTVTNETFGLLQESKRLVEEDSARGRAVNVSTGLVPMIKLCLFRVIVAMSFTIPLTWALTISSILSNNTSTLYNQWTLYIYGIMRMIGTFTATFTVDSLGRKLPTVFALIVGGGLMIGVGSIFSDQWNLVYGSDMGTAIGLLLLYQLFAGMVAPISTCFLGEAFSISVKPLFILVVVLVENVVQIIIYCTFDVSAEAISDYAFALGVIQIVFAIFFIILMPETKQTTLREALAKFKKTVNPRIS